MILDQLAGLIILNHEVREFKHSHELIPYLQAPNCCFFVLFFVFVYTYIVSEIIS
jgi:hypothetical protein